MSCAGCNDNPLPLANCNDGCEDCQPTNAVGLPPCPPNSEPCEEVTLTGCVKYVGPNLPTLGITNGMRLKQAFAALNLALTESLITKKYTITVSNTQSTTVVEYINLDGELATASVSSAQSPIVICAQEGSPVKMSGSGVLSAIGQVCPDIPN